ncbi:MAG: site-specific integrase [Lachnospiraceae bacterium]|nr:site-specific integrase [Lachnospiraceae bacterium]
MPKKVRKDNKGRALRRGESYLRKKSLYCFAYTDPLGKRHYVYAPDLPELREKEKSITQDRLDGVNLYVRAMADLNYVFDRYIATKTDLRSSTKTNYIYAYDRYVRNTFGRKKIAEIAYSDVLMFYKALLNTGLKLNTIDTIHCILHPTFQMAVRDRILRNNPSDGVMAQLKRGTKGKSTPRHALTLEEQREFLSYIEKPQFDRWRTLFIVMFGTGCRVGEIIGLRWEDCDFKNNLISINHDVTYYPRSDKNFRNEYELGLPKTEAGIRTIPMLDKVREALLEEKKYQDETGECCMMELGGMSGFIFSNRFGTIHNASGINREIKRIVEDHNSEEILNAAREGRDPILIPRFSCHITRHTFCSRLCENETNVKVIQTVMGHRDIQTTLGIYAETTESKRQEVFKELNNNKVF